MAGPADRDKPAHRKRITLRTPISRVRSRTLPITATKTMSPPMARPLRGHPGRARGTGRPGVHQLLVEGEVINRKVGAGEGERRVGEGARGKDSPLGGLGGETDRLEVRVPHDGFLHRKGETEPKQDRAPSPK